MSTADFGQFSLHGGAPGCLATAAQYGGGGRYAGFNDLVLQGDGTGTMVFVEGPPQAPLDSVYAVDLRLTGKGCASEARLAPVPRSITRSALAGDGLPVAVRVEHPAKVSVALTGRRRGSGRRVSLFTRRLHTQARRRLRVHPRRRALARVRTKLTLRVVVAEDGGAEKRFKRKIRLKR